MMKFLLTSSKKVHLIPHDYRNLMDGYARFLGEQGFNIEMALESHPNGDKWCDYYVEVNSLDGLLAMSDMLEWELIVDGPRKGNLPTIEIYDEYREV